MTVLWNIVFWLVPLWVFFMIPFATFYYEADDGMLMAGTAYAPNPVKKSRLAQACCYQLFVLVIMGVIFAVTYIALSDTKIPVESYVGTEDLYSKVYTIPATSGNFSISSLGNMTSFDNRWSQTTKNVGSENIVLRVSVSTFYAGLMAWLGWWLFALFGGIGLSALPLDLILTYLHRPRYLDAVQFAEIQVSLRDRTNELVEVGELLKIEREQKAAAGITNRFGTWSMDSETRKAAREERQAILGFKQAVYLLEEDVEQFKAATSNYENYNPLIPYISLILGCCSIIISVFWFIHIIVYVFPKIPLAPFLNNYFKWFDKWFSLFGVLSVALFTFYLLLAAVKGAFKFGIRFLFFQIHPMKPGKTYMSSFMFNIGLVLLCALPVVQFCQTAFADYAAFANIRQIFGVQIEYLQFFSWFWRSKFFIYMFVVLCVLTSIYLARKPNDQSASGQALRDRLRAHQGLSTSG
jgi:LMBR1 domain-containing protein 1